MSQKVAALPEVDQFKVKGKELVALALAIVARDDEKGSWTWTSILTVRRRAVVLLECAISFMESCLRVREQGNGGDVGV